MKVKVFYLAFVFSFLGIANAQDTNKNNKYINGKSEFNSWSLSAYVGPSSIYTGDLRTDEAAFKFGIDGQIGAVKWFNHGFGVEALLQFGKTQQTNATPNTKGNTKYTGLAINGMLNLNSVFRRADLKGDRKWNAYTYAGLGFMDFTSKVTNTITNVTSTFENDGPWRSAYVQVGAIISRRLNKKFDLSGRANFLLSGRDMFDGIASTQHANAQERLLTASIGLTYNFGDKEKLVWSDPFEYKLKIALKETTEYKTKALDLNDDDNDGVINQFDKEPNTLKGAIVDGTGKALDIDKDGIVDGIDKCPIAKGTKDKYGCPEVQKTNVPVVIKNDTSEKETLNAINIGLSEIKFDSGKAIIKPQYFHILNQAVTLIKKSTYNNFIITGYTDCLGNFSSNQKLSQRRAKSVKNYLISKGISNTKLKTKGEGENNPINTCTPCNSCSKNKHLENRRIELKILW